MADTSQYQEILESIASGLSVRKSCEAVKVTPSVFLRHVDKEQYARARKSCADVHFDGLLDTAEKIKKGDLDPQAGRVATDLEKWCLARMRPDLYGDKAAIEHTGPGGAPLTINVVRFGGEEEKDAQCPPNQ